MSLRLYLNRLDEWPGFGGLEGPVRRAVKAALATGGEAGQATAGKAGPAAGAEASRGEISVTFLPDAEMRELHRRFLGREATTDVLAFQLGEAGELLGDVYVGPEAAARSAEALGIPAREELLRLVIHGVLHLLGHEHPEGEDRVQSPMFRVQEEVLRRLRP